MSFLPGTEILKDEVLEIVGLAHSFLVEKENFDTLQYIKSEADIRLNRMLIEKILAVSIKYRFLDEKISLIKKYDRKIPTLGKLTVDGERVESVSVREALNKIIHHNEIDIDFDSRNVMVIGGGANTGDITIPKGDYELNSLVLIVKGKHHKKLWEFHIDLFILLNEILRIMHLNASNNVLK